jgi:hypothetical protein
VYKIKCNVWTEIEVYGQLISVMTFENLTAVYNGRDSAVGRATGYGLDDRGVGVRVPLGSRIFSLPRRPDRLWVPPSLLSNGYWGLFPWG